MQLEVSRLQHLTQDLHGENRELRHYADEVVAALLEADPSGAALRRANDAYRLHQRVPIGPPKKGWASWFK